MLIMRLCNRIRDGNSLDWQMDEWMVAHRQHLVPYFICICKGKLSCGKVQTVHETVALHKTR